MAREFAKKLYNTKEWKGVRDSIIKRDNYICVYCGNPAEEVHHVTWLNSKNVSDKGISVSNDNLISLCRDCHFKLHKEATALAVAKSNMKRRADDTPKGFAFDDEGNMVRTQKIYLITGSPGSGKTTYALKQMDRCDIIVDMDMLVDAITGRENKDDRFELMGLAFDIRDMLYKSIREYKGKWVNAYVVATLPKHEDRMKAVNELHAQLIEMNTSKDECISRVLKDSTRKDKEKQVLTIREYWNKYTTATGD